VKLLAVIPALNAERTIGDVVRKAREQLQDVIVIDDGSADRTGEIARSEGADVLRHEVNRGKGASLKTGFAYAREHGCDAVITLDADGQHLPSEIPKIIQAWQESGADLVIGGRAHLFQQMLPRRRFANRFSTWAIAKAAGVRVNDSQSGFRLYSARVMREIELRTDGFDMESEVIIRAGVRKMRIVVTPIDLGFIDGLSTSHYRPLGDTLRIAWTAFRARFVWR
jgi:glycosyltransferase involved in cell wall biosynthesis